MRWRLLLAAVGTCAGLVIAELLLQVAAWVVWNNRQVVEQDLGGAEEVVLCLGDSFTYGFGASTPEGSYPARAQQLVAAQGERRITFVNRGWPGQTSRDVLEHLPGALQRYRPQLVYVLIGTNDDWDRPSRLDLAEDAGTEEDFPIRWRTRRLALLLVDWLWSEDAEEVAPFIGVWHTDGVEVQFSPSGELRVGEEIVTWSMDDDAVLTMQMPDGWVLPIRWRMEEGNLRVESSAWAQPFLLEPGPRPQSGNLYLGWEAFARGDFEAAARGFEQLTQDPNDAVGAREGLVRALARLRRGEAAAEHLDWLRERYRTTRDPDAGESLAMALVAVENLPAALEVSRELLQQHAEVQRALTILVEHGTGHLRSETLEFLAERAARAQRGSNWRTRLLAVLARELLPHDQVAAVRVLLDIVRERGGEDPVFDELRWSGYELEPQQLDLALDEIEPEETWIGARLRERLVADGRVPSAVLDHHLEQIVERCKSTGARCVFLNYPGGPFAKPGLNEGLRRAAAESGADFLDVEKRFASIGATDAYYVADGHCSDLGYAEIARLVAEHALARTR